MTKLKEVEQILRTLLENQVTFTKYTPELLEELTEITNCANLDETQTCQTKKYCLHNASSCALLVPEQNLISGNNNEKIYFGQVTDEIVRYSRIKAFIFQI